MRNNLPAARAGREDLYDRMRLLYAHTIVEDAESSLDELQEALATLISIEAKYRQVLGKNHPQTLNAHTAVETARWALDARTRGAAQHS